MDGSSLVKASVVVCYLGQMPNQNLSIQYGSKHMVHADLHDNKGNPFSITFVYGQPNHAKREEVWFKLKLLRNNAHSNWLCIRDFNQVLSHQDKFSFNNRTIVGANLFQKTLNELELYELKAKGQRYTWMNRKEDETFVMERLDRAFTSIEWINSYPLYALQNQPILRSDHGSIILDFEMQQPFRRRPFRFENVAYPF